MVVLPITVADDEFALAASEREQGVDHDQAGLHRLDDQIPIDDRRRGPLYRHARLRRDRPLAVQRSPERVDDAAEQFRPHRRAHDIARATHAVACLDAVDVVEEDAADAIPLQRLHEAELPLLEFQEFGEARVGQAGDERDAVPDLLHPADFLGLRAERGGVELMARVAEPAFGPRAMVICHAPAPPGLG
jgi:hypothetical protein